MYITVKMNPLRRCILHLKWKSIHADLYCWGQRTFSLAKEQRIMETGSPLLNLAVILSASQDVYMNLAMEDWLYKNCNFSNRPWPLLLLWRNGPCVVIGRHQNPWTECKLTSMIMRGIQLARRNSGGGTVYHDLGNLNCTFFTRRSNYNRKKNLQLLCEALKRKWNIDVAISPREDILLDNIYKISGTAAKLGRTMAYHHCTILFDANAAHISEVLRMKPINEVESKATKSIGSRVKNLKDVIPSISFDTLVEVIGDMFRQEYQVSGPTKILTPCEEHMPGLMEIYNHLQSWEWTFGKCPSFLIQKRLQLWPEMGVGPLNDVTLNIQVQNGLIEEIKFEPDGWMNDTSKTILTNMTGKRFPIRRLAFGEPREGFGFLTKHHGDLEEKFLRNSIEDSMTQLL